MLKKQEQSMTKKWIIHEKKGEVPESFLTQMAEELKVGEVLSRLLYSRGYHTVSAAKNFLCMESEMLADPFLLNDVEKGIERIRQAIERGERITVYGDYDVDGVTSVCTMYLYLRSKGGLVDYYIPNRAGEGYGVSKSAVDTLSERGTKLILTVDTGITANEEVAYAKTLGIDFVVTDHHECQNDLPEAVAVINPHRKDSTYPFRELAGVGVVFKTICAYEETVSGDSRIASLMRICDAYGDLVAIGTIADVMPIKEENKLIVSYGLSRIEKAPRMGLSALIESVQNSKLETGKKPKKPGKITSGFIGYTIAPRLNAAGRIRSASLAVELFLTEDRARAAALAEELCEANRERQAEENRIMEEAYAKIEVEHDFEHDRVIVLAADDWHHGVIGIVASRITERYGLPCLLVSFEGCDPAAHTDEDVGKGSGRSIKGLNLVNALLHCSGTLLKFGGHELAAGLSVSRGSFALFKEAINRYAADHLDEEAMIPTVEADCELSFRDINMPLAENLRILEPYGVGNPVPAFLIRGASVAEIVPVSGGRHTRLSLGDGKVFFTAMCFSSSPESLNLYVGEKADLIFNLDINEWNGRKSVQLVVKDIRPAEGAALSLAEEKAEFDRIWAGGSFSPEDGILPSRDDFVAVYTAVRRQVRAGVETMTHRSLLSQLPSGEGRGIGYVKLKLIIRILQELNLLGIEEVGDEVYHFRLQFQSGKTDLEKSNLLRRLRSQMKQA